MMTKNVRIKGTILFRLDAPTDETEALLREATQCARDGLPFHARGKDWRVTFVDVVGGRLAIDGIEFDEFQRRYGDSAV